jgi:hypothetical protein
MKSVNTHPNIVYRDLLGRLRSKPMWMDPKSSICVNVGGERKFTIPIELLSVIPYFKKFLTKLMESQQQVTDVLFVPYDPNAFHEILNFLYDPDSGLDPKYWRAWRFFFCCANVSAKIMDDLQIPDILHIPITPLKIYPTDWDNFRDGPHYFSIQYDKIAAVSSYFKKLYENQSVAPFTGSDPEHIYINETESAFNTIIYIACEEFAQFQDSKVNLEVLDTYCVELPACVCGDTRYRCQHRHTKRKCCGVFQNKPPCECKCRKCGKWLDDLIKIEEDSQFVCKECKCASESCMKNSLNGGIVDFLKYCRDHRCRHTNDPTCTVCFCNNCDNKISEHVDEIGYCNDCYEDLPTCSYYNTGSHLTCYNKISDISTSKACKEHICKFCEIFIQYLSGACQKCEKLCTKCRRNPRGINGPCNQCWHNYS